MPTPLEPRQPLARVLVATDFSSGAVHAVARAGRLPLADGARIALVHVLAERLPQEIRELAEAKAGRGLDEARRALVTAARANGRRDLQLSVELLRGRAHAEIIRQARLTGAELIVLGRHGRRPVRDMLIGSTAERVIRAGSLPVLVVARRATRGYRRPVLAVDLEPTGPAIAGFAVRLLDAEIDRMTMLHAYHVPFAGLIEPGHAPQGMSELRKAYAEEAGAGMTRLQQRLAQLGVRWRSDILHGEPRTAIVAEVARRRADLVVVGTHGRSGLSHALLGSVAEWITRTGICDVLVVRPARVRAER